VKQAQESRAATALTLLAAVAWLAATAWIRPLVVPDEGRYIGVAWEMLRSGDWLTPTLDGLPYFHKPPLFYWITAASLDVFGPSEFAGRAASLVGAAFAAIALYLFARRRLGTSTARGALLALVTQPLFFIGAQFANLDMLVAGCIAATILALADCALSAGLAERRASLAIAYLFAALGVLAKGLIGAVLPALVIAVWLLLQRRVRSLLQLIWLPGIVLFLCVAAPWFLAMQSRFPDFTHYFFVVQHFQRFAQGGFNNAQPFWFFPAVIALLALPWTAWLLGCGRAGYWSDPQRGDVRRLMWVWLAAITVFFTLPQSKLVGYIFPVLPALAWLAADAAQALVERAPRYRSLWRFSGGLAAAACIAAAMGAALVVAYPQRDIGRVLRAKVAPGDQVVYVGDYYFALEFYGQLRSPIVVVANWDSDQARRDNWRKELLDASKFAANSASLIAPQALGAKLCASMPSWVVGGRDASREYPSLARAEQVAASGNLVLWRVPPVPAGAINVPGCPGRPSANSIDKS
jgi:4-amino-4-deoxy-L-arabinose transferase-like glycosyltransferase